jgi:hypothetical protein
MNVALLILALAFLAFGSYVTIVNWCVFVQNHIIKKKWSSCITLLGGGTLSIGLLLLPVDGVARFAWLPLVLDWGSLPVIVASLVIHLRMKNDTRHKE